MISPALTRLATLLLASLVELRAADVQPARPLQLAQNGATRYAILVPDEAAPVEITAAEELRAYLKKITGATLVVVKEALAVDGQPVLAVGRTRKFASTFPEIACDTLKPDSIVMQSKGEDLFLVGEGPRGTIYAVNTFLEDICGVRWWSPFAETVPDNPGLAVSPLATVCQPAFFYRDTHSQIFTDTMVSKYGNRVPKGLEERRRFAARCKNNGNNSIPAAWGGNLTIVISQKCYRTFEQFIGPHEFYKTHPAWFQGGASHLTQLCLSNEAMRNEFLKRAKAWVDAAPDQNVFVIMHNDNTSYCKCPRCAAIDAAEGSPSGSQVRFMNFLSEELEKHRPGLQLVMDAYNYSTKPPALTKPRANVIIMLCPPILSQLVAKDQEFMDKWAAWKKITSRILIWDYTVNFASFVSPYPNLRFLGPNIKTFAQQGALGVFSQGNQFNSVSDCDELKSWVIAHLLWDPYRDADALIAEFVNGYYGAATKPVMAYLDLIVRAGSGAKEQGETAISWLDLQAMNEATRLLNEARAIAAGDPVLEERVARIRFTLDHEWLLEWRTYRKQADEQGLPFLGPETVRKALELVRQETARFGATHNNEHYGYGTMKRHLETIQAALDAAVPGKPLPPPYDQIPTADVFQIQDNLLNLSSGAKGVADPLASDGKAVSSPCTHKDWNIQVNRTFFRTLHRMTGVEGKWECVIFVRADARQQTGPAMQMGIYCWGNPAVRPQKKVAIEQLTPDAYTPIEVGSLDLATDALLNTDIWVGPLENPELMNAIYVDRVVFIRNKPDHPNTGKK